MLDFEFDVCEDCMNDMQVLTDAGSVLGGADAVDVLAELCAPCAEEAQKALQGGPMWN